MRHNATSWNVTGSIPYVSFEFFIDVILPSALWLANDSVSGRNECQQNFLEGSTRLVRRPGSFFTFMCRLKSGSLNLLETSRPVQACIRFMYFTLICLLRVTKCFVKFMLFILRLFSSRLNISIIIIIIMILLLHLEIKLFNLFCCVMFPV